MTTAFDFKGHATAESRQFVADSTFATAEFRQKTRFQTLSRTSRVFNRAADDPAARSSAVLNAPS
ncbi:MAG: hypothetical protein HC927_12475 [Deltaproteobacteria bacterium]|nr:hypothetical protein [Deltaproteobacteria bacterium]